MINKWKAICFLIAWSIGAFLALYPLFVMNLTITLPIGMLVMGMYIIGVITFRGGD